MSTTVRPQGEGFVIGIIPEGRRIKQALLALSCLSWLCCGSVGEAQPQGSFTYRPPAGYVPDARTAIRIAVAVWSPIYGEKQIQGEKPFHASLKHGIWTVTGSLPSITYVGGVSLAEISKKDGRVLRVIHGK